MDFKKFAVDKVQNSFELLQIDLDHIPEEDYDRVLGGQARTVADLVYELNMVNDHVGLTMRGEPLFDWPEGWLRAPVGLKDKESSLAAFRGSMDQFVKTVQGLTEEALFETILSDGRETTRFQMAIFVAQHNWYHSGQLNFIQTLLGDAAWHWNPG